MTDQTNKRRLGRGLTGMIASVAHVQVKTSAVPESEPGELAIELLTPNRNQPRVFFDDASLKELAASVRQHGILQPLLVRKSGEQYEIIAGERRWRAAQLAGLTTVPAIIREVTDQESAEWALVENLQREDLGALERANAFQRLVTDFGLTHGQIGERVGVDRSTIANFIRLLELEPEIQDLINNDRLSFGHGKALLAAPAGPGRVALARDAASGEWSVRRLERAASSIAKARRPQASGEPTKAFDDRAAVAIRSDLEDRLGQFLSTKVAIQRDSRGPTGRLIIEFYGHEQFEGLLEKIGFQGRTATPDQ
ncbi:MAG: putative chromosome-partitioning protein ParB [Phycisphaerales bacterium]|nr:putative chromosome-partitioning protein ParB [Phycisphaerales bacterium]